MKAKEIIRDVEGKVIALKDVKGIKSRPDSICECGHNKEKHFKQKNGKDACSSKDYCECEKYNPSPRATSRGSHEVVEDVSTHDRGSNPSVDTNDFSERIEKIIVDAVMIRGSQSTKYAYAIQRGIKEALEAVEKVSDKIIEDEFIEYCQTQSTPRNQESNMYIFKQQVKKKLSAKIVAWLEELK